MTIFNSLQTYTESGRRAGHASRHGDQALVNHESQWVRRAIALEQGNYAKLARQCYDAAYREAATPRVCYFR